MTSIPRAVLVPVVASVGASVGAAGLRPVRALGGWSALLAVAHLVTVWRALALLGGAAPSVAPVAEGVPRSAVDLAVRLADLLGAPATMLALALVALVSLAVEVGSGRAGGGASAAGVWRVVRAVRWVAAGPVLALGVLATSEVIAYVVMGLVVLALAAGPLLLALLPLARWAPVHPDPRR